jgi:glycosyltransferase involved in cell wall biosynthesis
MTIPNFKKLISIITPCFNESQSVGLCILEVRSVMTQELPNYDYEHIFVDNSSEDSTVEKIKEFAINDSRIKLIVNSRNIGSSRNIWNGLKNAQGDIIIPMVPADLQDPPSVMPEMIKNWEAGSLVVYGIRSKRLESFVMRNIRALYYRIIKKFSGDEIPLNSGEFLLADRKIIDSILKVDDEYPYIRGLIAQTGVKYSSVSYTWRKRMQGKSKNGFASLIDQGLNGLISTTRLPARITILLGLILSLTALISAFVMFMFFLINPDRPALGIPTLIVSVLFFSGLQLLFLGIIGEYVLSINSQVRKRPPFFEVERVNFNE